MKNIMKDVVDRMASQLQTLSQLRNSFSALQSAASGVPALSTVASGIYAIAVVMTEQVVAPFVELQIDLREGRGPVAKTLLQTWRGLSDNVERVGRETDLISDYPMYVPSNALSARDLLLGIATNPDDDSLGVVNFFDDEGDSVRFFSNWNTLEPQVVPFSFKGKGDGTTPPWWEGAFKVTLSPLPYESGDYYRLRLYIAYNNGSSVEAFLRFTHWSKSMGERYAIDLEHHHKWNLLVHNLNDFQQIQTGTDFPVFATSCSVHNAFEQLDHPGDLAYLPHTMVREALITLMTAGGMRLDQEPWVKTTDPGYIYRSIDARLKFKGPVPLTKAETTSRLQVQRTLEQITGAHNRAQFSYRDPVFDEEQIWEEGVLTGHVYSLNTPFVDSSYKYTAFYVLDFGTKTGTILVWARSKESWVKITPRTNAYLLDRFEGFYNAWFDEKKARVDRERANLPEGDD